jgi:hypothetical protein
MNSPFLDQAKWEATVKEMIGTYGAPISPEDATVIDYLAAHYGKQAMRRHGPTVGPRLAPPAAGTDAHDPEPIMGCPQHRLRCALAVMLQREMTI